MPSPKDPAAAALSHREFLEAVLNAYLDRCPKTGRLIKVNSQKDVAMALKGVEPKKFRNAKTGRLAAPSQNYIGDFIAEALQKVPVTLTPGKSEDWKAASLKFYSSRDKLKEKYGLKELAVASPFNESSEEYLPSVGKEAAQLFTKLTNAKGKPLKIGIGGGRTIREMIPWLEPSPLKEIRISAINYATRIPDKEIYDSSYLAMQIHSLYPKGSARVVSIPPLPSNNIKVAALWHSKIYQYNPDVAKLFKESLDPDVVFVGAGNFERESPSISRVYQHLGIDYNALAAMSTPPVGDINLCFFNRAGTDITPIIMKQKLQGKIPNRYLDNETFFQEQQYCHPFLIGMNIKCLKWLVRKGKTVVLVAGGEGDKVEAIHTCLATKIVNALVTDATTMERLLSVAPTKQTFGLRSDYWEI